VLNNEDDRTVTDDDGLDGKETRQQQMGLWMRQKIKDSF
jgi:hypothetical protein